MNILPIEKRALILAMLVEGNSMRGTARVLDISPNTVAKLLRDAGAACADYHDRMVRDIAPDRVECDEIWSFVYARNKNVDAAKDAPEGQGTSGPGRRWTRTASS